MVTGAASGIGAETSRALARGGARVVLLDRDDVGLQRTLADLRSIGSVDSSAHVVDVADSVAMRRIFAWAASSSGGIDQIVCAAGVLRPGTLDEVSDDDFDLHLRVNAGGTLHCLRAASTHLAPGGAVVVVSSNAARVPRTGMVAYAASKGAVSAMTRAAGLELAGRGIRCNVVEPGSTDTPMQRDLWSDPDEGRLTALAGDLDQHRIGIPLGRMGDPRDVAALVVFLLSDAARHVTLQQIFVDGGASL